MKKPALLLLTLLQSIILFAGATVKIGPAPSWLEPITLSGKQTVEEREVSGFYYPLLEEQTNIRLTSDYVRVIRKIVNESGVQSCSQISVSFIPEFQELTFHTLAIRRDGKLMNRLTMSDIKVIQKESELDNNIYTGISDALIIIEDLRKGDELEYSYSIKGNNPIFLDKYQETVQIASYYPIASYSRVIIAETSKKFFLKYYNDAPQPIVMTKGNSNIYKWEDMNVPAYSAEGLTPSWFIDYKYIEISEYNSWNEVAKWAYNVLNRYEQIMPEELKQKIELWKTTMPGDLGFFTEQATRFVQDQIRYQGMEVGPYTHRPYAPAEVYKKRYGDCKDKALLLVCILRSQNIPAWLCLTSTGWGEQLQHHLPGPNMFNHAIVKAIIKGKVVWIDATLSQQRGPILDNYIPYYGSALVVAENTEKPESITKIEGGSVVEENIFDIEEKPDAVVRMAISTTYDKHCADFFRASRNANSMRGLEDGYEDYYKQSYTGIKLDGTVKIDDDTIHNTIKTDEEYGISKFWKEKGDGKYVCNFEAKSIFNRLVNPQKANSKQPLAFNYPVRIKQTLILNFQTAWTIGDKPFEIKTEEYYFSFKPVKTDRQIKLEYTLITYKDHIPAEKVDQYKKDYAKIVEHLSYAFSRDLSTGASVTGQTSARLNWMIVILAIAGFAGAVFLMMHLNKKTTYVDEFERLHDYPIGGWLILLAIALFVRVALYLKSFSTVNYFNAGLWTMTTDSGSSSIQAIFLLELLMTILGLVFSVTLIFWFFKRRDIFPKMLVILAIVELAFNGVELAYALYAQSDIDSFLPDFTRDSGTAFLRSLFFLIVWGSAVTRSQRSKYTFTKPNTRNVMAPEYVLPQQENE